MAVPNVSEGRDAELIARLREAFAPAGVTLLDEHSDAIHNRTVFTLAGQGPALREALLAGAAESIETIDLRTQTGSHPRIGALDVCPVVWPRVSERAEARKTALGLVEPLAALGLPVFRYGEIAEGAGRNERAFFRRGGLDALAARMRSGELRPDAGPPEPHPSAGAVLVTERAPLAAFNLELVGCGLDQGREIAGLIRESGGGPAGLRAIAIELGEGRIQISTNVHDPATVPLAAVVDAVGREAERFGAAVEAAELVGLVPEAALVGFPPGLEWIGTPGPERTIEDRLRSV